MAKRFKTHLIRTNQSYDVFEVSQLLSCSEQTVRGWIKTGLPALDSKKPILILGYALKEYLNQKQSATKKTGAGEFYCMSCRSPQKAFGLMADYIPQNDKSGRLEALCETCGNTCMRFTSIEKLCYLEKILEIKQMPQAEPKPTF